jgi:hypothetical protein
VTARAATAMTPKRRENCRDTRPSERSRKVTQEAT